MLLAAAVPGQGCWLTQSPGTNPEQARSAGRFENLQALRPKMPTPSLSPTPSPSPSPSPEPRARAPSPSPPAPLPLTQANSMHQVLRYAEGGEYQPHYDANERSRRVLTVQSP